MTNKKTKFIAIAIIGLALTLPSVSLAESVQPSNILNGVSSLPSVEEGIVTTPGSLFARLSRPDNVLQGGQFYSSTSSYYLKIGIKRYEKGKLDKAEKAFETVLRTNDLKKLSYLYLAHINAQQGDRELELKYTQAYHSIPETEIPAWRGGKG